MLKLLNLMFKDCAIKINTSTSLGFQDQDWAAIVITVRDFNKKLIHFGTDVSNKIAPGMFSLSATAVQVSRNMI